MRLFVAVELDSAVAAAAERLIQLLRERATRIAPGARITWIPAARLHLTVRFIGNVAGDRAEAIAAALQPRLAAAPFDLTLANTGAFPRGGRPQVLWAGITAGLDALHRVERDVTGRLAAVGVAPEQRPYSPHLTLARIRDAAGLRAAALFDGMPPPVLGTTTVEAITLFESRLSPKGPTYVPLQRTPLRSA